MVSSIPNNFTVNKQNNPLSAEVVTNNPVQTKSGSLENSPQTDTVSLSNKQPMSKKTKIFLNLGGIATAVIGAVLAVKGYKSHKITKTLDQIEQKFVKLKENVPEAQKTFKDVFLRSDISEKETIEMLDRYKDIEKLGITGTKEEYIQAAFKEAKRNFGFEDCNFKLEFSAKNSNELGGATGVGKKVTFNPSTKTADVQNVMHHEMRHMKQHYLAVNYDPPAYINALHERVSCIPEVKISKKEFDEVVEDSLNDIKESFNIRDFSRNNVPSELREYAQKCIDSCRHYVHAEVNYDKYYNNFLEIDARHAGSEIDKLFYGKHKKDSLL
jgi:hypothetical protein